MWGVAEEVECIRNGKADPSVALTSSIHLLVLFLNLIHLAAQQTRVACWKGFTCVMDAIVRNAKVNMWHSSKTEKTFFFIPKVLAMYHQVCSLTFLPSVITFSVRTTAGCMLMGWRWSFKRVTALTKRGLCHSWQSAGILLTLRRIWEWSRTVCHELWETIISWFEHLNWGATVWLHAASATAISCYGGASANHHVNRLRNMKWHF